MNDAVVSSAVKKEPPVEEILLTIPQDEKPHPLRVRLLTYWNGTRDVHFPYGGCTRDIITRIADVLQQRGLQLKDDNGDAWPTGIYFSVAAMAL
jgi:hypothetical protein